MARPRSIKYPFYILSGIVLLFAKPSLAAQFGPIFPTHRFPTDESFHLGYGLVYGKSSSNFVGSRSTEPLEGQSKLRLLRQQLTAEFQPNRRLSTGAILHFDSLTLNNPTTDTSVSKHKLSDQRVFMEYRFSDGPGYSIGLAAMLKFPFYKNPTLTDIPADGSGLILMGDAQTDFTTLLTGEYWGSDNLRFRSNLGYTFRTEAFASEMPFYFSLAFVSPRVDFELKFLGNFTIGNDSFDDESTDLELVRVRFGNSEYAYSASPWVMAVEPELTFWVDKEWGIITNLRYALLGNRSPNFYTAMLGLTYRWSETSKRVKRTLQDVDIGIDQDVGQFPGE